ncbi:(Fe-S)-binding protein [Spiractinospora alimapuensis]|uniref:(Fe-S)-binding protein n=1 Tax=Spiractinospora alimapuensis TaxID=2820884 RepID=UPI001F43553B|nr:(Fe-S)-binding protein [Spiractinospora alimapuensis]QVQ50824.1 (Fe-S)-binding protein [Spiractinospora alimapuensis]
MVSVRNAGRNSESDDTKDTDSGVSSGGGVNRSAGVSPPGGGALGGSDGTESVGGAEDAAAVETRERGEAVGRRAMPREVALFVTCVGDFAASGPARAAVTVLERMGVRVTVPKAQSCCGQPALNSGFPVEAAALARHWVEVFEPHPAVVAIAGSCAGMTVHHYPRILDGPWRARAEAILDRMWEFTRFVADHGENLALRTAAERTVTYHDSCHMLRNLRERDAPREVLGRVEGLELREMRDPDICCGFGGTFAVKFPEVSTAMADRKLRQVHDTGATELVSADSGCLLHLDGRRDASGETTPRACHVAEILRDALPREPR